MNHFKISRKYYISFGAAITLHIVYLLLRANIWPKLEKSIRYPSFLIFSLFDDDDDNGNSGVDVHDGYRREGLKWTRKEFDGIPIKIAWNEGASLLLIGHKCKALFRHKVGILFGVVALALHYLMNFNITQWSLATDCNKSTKKYDTHVLGRERER